VNQAFEQKVRQFNGALATEGTAPKLNAMAGDFIVDLVDYLALSDPYYWINNVFRKELLDIVEAGQRSGVDQAEHEIYILSHSLGTVVSYEALHSIINDAQTLGKSSNFNIKAFFTFGSPLAFIKANQKRLPHLNNQFALRAEPIGRPTRKDTFTEETQTNVLDWYNMSQEYDPVASLVPLTEATANGALSQESFVFKEFHSGANPHAFENYIKEYAPFIMETIRA
jgi:hypothetical protein